MSDQNQPIVESDQNLITKELLAKEAIKIKDLQKKLLILKNALIEEKKKTTQLEQLSSEMKSQIKQLEDEIILKDEEIVKLNKEIMEVQNSISLGKNKIEDEIKEKDKKKVSNIIGNVINKTKSLASSSPSDKNIPNEVLLEIENKQLKKKNEEMQDELNNTKNKFLEEKTVLVNINISNEKIIKELNEALRSKENAINLKNKQLNENQQRIEMLLNNNKIWDLEKGKFNAELKSTQDKVEQLEKSLKDKDEILLKWQNDIKKYSQENLELFIKLKNLNYEIANSKRKLKKFKCELINQPENILCEISFGPTSENEYVMLLQMKEDELIQIRLIDVEYIRMNKQQNALDVSILHKENFKKFSIYHNDKEILNILRDTYEDYFNIAMRMKEGLNNA
jgi:chromosome segregation protein